MRQTAPAGALTGRTGGDEFAIALPHGDRLDSEDFVSMFRDAAADAVSQEGLKLRCALTIGMACAPRDAGTVGELLRAADLALAAAKVSPQRQRWFEPDRDTTDPQSLHLAASLADALRAGEVEPYFQPQVRAHDGKVVGFEALARWTSSEHGKVEPSEFVRIAEQVGLTGQLIELMLDRSLRQLDYWKRYSPNLRIAVNVSAIDLASRDLVSLVSAALYTHNIEPSRLVIEMTETSFVHDLAEISSSVTGLRSLGVAVSLDDFGTGYSALTSLRDLPVDEIKIDRSFVDRVASGTDRDTRIARAMTSMGRSLGLDVVAEGVEDQKTRERLIEMGCTHLQGFFFGSPMSRQETTAWLKDNQTAM